MPLYHETPDDPMNQDSRWAERISEDVRMPLIKIGRVVDGNRSFEPAAEYPNREIPEEPVYWSDIEGYLSRISEMEADASRIHVTGFGGDELFASMPSSSWSCLREHPLRLQDIRRQYSADYRVPPYQAILDLTDGTDLHEELRSSFLDAEQGHDHRSSPCGWHDAIRIPEFLTAKARNILYGAVESQLKHADIRPLNPDRSRHQALYSLSMQARMLNQVNRTFASNDITFRSPLSGPRNRGLCAMRPNQCTHRGKSTQSRVIPGAQGHNPRNDIPASRQRRSLIFTVSGMATLEGRAARLNRRRSAGRGGTDRYASHTASSFHADA